MIHRLCRYSMASSNCNMMHLILSNKKQTQKTRSDYTWKYHELARELDRRTCGNEIRETMVSRENENTTPTACSRNFVPNRDCVHIGIVSLYRDTLGGGYSGQKITNQNFETDSAEVLFEVKRSNLSTLTLNNGKQADIFQSNGSKYLKHTTVQCSW